MPTPATIIVDGKVLAQERLVKLAAAIQTLSRPPRLVVVLVGDDPASVKYVERKRQTGASVGIVVLVHHLPQSTTTAEAQAVIAKIIQTDAVDGLIVQLPLPEHIDTVAVLNSVPAAVDVDCLTATNWYALEQGNPLFIPPVAGAVLDIFDYYRIELTGMEVVLVGYGRLVGQPLSLLLRQRPVHVSVCTAGSADLAQVLPTADVIISGVGQPGLITGELVKAGAIVIDVGSSLVNGKLKGDVDFDSVAPKARLITPTPGGVGPLTVVRLLENVVQAAQNKV